MKFGVYLNAQHPHSDDPTRRFAETIEQVRLIRRLGFDSIWGGEHHITEGYHYFPLLPLLQRLAAEADGMELGTNIVLLPMHNPIEIAEITAFLDMITEGRFHLGVGLGYRQEEFDMFAVPIKQRVSRMVEGVEIIRRLWTEDNVTHNGRHWQFENVTIRPQPSNKPRPPLLVAAQVKASIMRAATLGDGMCVVPAKSFAATARDIDLFQTTRTAAGLPKSEHIARMFEVSCAADEATALSRAAPFLLEKYASYAKWGMLGVDIDPADTPETQLQKVAADRFAIGNPQQVTDALVAQQRLGATHITMRVSWPGMAQDDILASLELIGTKVLPQVRKCLAINA